MPGKGMTCWDKRELCDLNCVYATTAENEDFSLTDCSTGCMTSQAACTDSAETLAYVDVSVRQTSLFFFFVLYDTANPSPSIEKVVRQIGRESIASAEATYISTISQAAFSDMSPVGNRLIKTVW